MAIYKFKALNDQGKSVEGRQVAGSERAAFDRIRERGLRPVEISPLNQPRRKRSAGQKLKRADLTRNLKQLATLIQAGVPLLVAIENLERANEQSELALRYASVSQHLRQGGQLSEGLRTYYPEYPDYVASLTELGEKTGQLGRTLSDAADRMAADDALAKDIQSALYYPAILATVGGAIVLGMFVFVIPRFGALLDRSGTDIPALSRIVIGTGTWLQSNWHLLLLGIVAAAVAIRAIPSRRNPLVTSILPRLPLFSSIIHKSEFESWARTFGVALANGAQLLPAFDLATKTVRAPGLSVQLEGVRRDLRSGIDLEEALATNVLSIDPMLIDLVTTGRKSGTLDQMLILASDGYKADISTMTKRLTSIAEPVAILIISGVVGLIVVAVVLAMTSLYEFQI